MVPTAPFRSRAAALFAAAVAASAPLAAQRVPPWRVLREMQVTGASYERDDLAGALVADIATLRELQRPLDDEAAAFVAERIATMHRVGGHAAATASGRFADGVLQVEVQAGPRRRWRQVRCEGNAALTDAQLVAALTTPPSDAASTSSRSTKAALPLGAFADTTPSRMQALQRIARGAYEDVGRYGTEVRVAAVPADDAVDLVVTVLDEGKATAVGALRLVGEPDAETRAAITAWAAPAPETLATRETRQRLHERIAATARYAKVEVEAAPADGEAPTALTVAVTRVAEPPPFDVDRMAEAAQLDRALQRSLSQLRGGDALHLQFEVEEPLVLPSLLTVHPGPFDLALGTSGLHVRAERVSWGDGAPERFALQLAPTGLVVVAGDRGDAIERAADSLLSIQFQLVTDLTADGRAELRWGIGASTGDRTEFAANMHPSFARKMLGEADEVRRDGEDLLLRYGARTLRIGPDGEVRGQPVQLTVRGVDLAGALVAGLPPLAAGGATEAGALRRVFAAVLGQAVPHPTDRERIQAMVDGVIDGVIAAWPAPSAAGAEQDTPSLGGEAQATPAFPLIVAALVQQLAVRRHFDGDLVDACACIGAYAIGDRRTVGETLDALAGEGGAGPLYLATLARVFAWTGNQRTADGLLARARRLWSFDAAWDDAADLLANAPFLADVPARAGARFRASPALQPLFADLPDGPDADRRAFQVGVRYWWSHGGEQMVKALLMP